MTMKHTAFIFLVSVQLFVVVFGATTVSKRSIESIKSTNTTSKSIEYCQPKQTCGWAVYNKIHRYIEYFMQNKCECPENTECFRDEDNIKITAFVYKCISSEEKSKQTMKET